jgi:hypothetical protein
MKLGYKLCRVDGRLKMVEIDGDKIEIML